MAPQPIRTAADRVAVVAGLAVAALARRLVR